MPLSKTHFSKRLLSIYKSKTSVYLVNFALEIQLANLVKIYLSFLLSFYCVRCVLNSFVVEIAIDRNKIVRVSKCKPNGVILFNPMILNVCRLSNTGGCDICKGMRVSFKVFYVRINILFSGHQKLIASRRR